MDSGQNFIRVGRESIESGETPMTAHTTQTQIPRAHQTLTVRTRDGRSLTIMLSRLSPRVRDILLSLPPAVLQRIVETYLDYPVYDDVHDLCFPSIEEVLEGTTFSDLYAGEYCESASRDSLEYLSPIIWRIINSYRSKLLARATAIAIQIKNTGN